MDQTQYWFAAKRYGWGWGLPLRREGWFVLGAFGVVLASIAALVDPTVHPTAYLVATGIASVILIAVCWWKGEPTRWRWGR